MLHAGVKQLVISSSANVYGKANANSVFETVPAVPNNRYGKLKLMVEDILRDLFVANPAWRAACLRYFNPVGAHTSDLIRENPLDMPGNLMPLINPVTRGMRAKFSIFGYDYATPNGTGVRDFIHVMDLAESHLAALRYLSGQKYTTGKFLRANAGTGKGLSVLEMALAFENKNGVAVPYEVSPPSAEDIEVSYADVSLTEKTMYWKVCFNLEDICKDSWHWYSMNPKSYQG